MNDEINPNNPMNIGSNTGEIREGDNEHPSTVEPQPLPQHQHRPRPDKKPKPPKEPQPDHFLAIRLSHDPSVTSTITTIHNSILKHSPHLEEACVDPMSAHITIGVLHLPTEEHKKAAQATLLTAARAAALDTPCSVTLKGLSNFRNQVVFLELAKEEVEEKKEEEEKGRGGGKGVVQLATAVRHHFKEQGLLLQANRAFVPHVTVAKLSQMQPWKHKKTGGRSRGGRGGKRRWQQQQRQERSKDQIDEEDMDKQEELLEKEEEAMVDVDSIKNESNTKNLDTSNKNDAQNKSTQNKQKMSIPIESYSALCSVSTSPVEVREIQLCAMQGRKYGEYYKVIASASVVVAAGAEKEEKEIKENEEDASMAEAI